jgi:lipoprotein-anchoring transpeptidase ErfK/SrfK
MRSLMRLMAGASPALLLAVSVVAPAAPAQASMVVVAFPDSSYSPGSIIVKTSERRLYFVIGGGRAQRFPVGVGMAGKRWTGFKRIERRMWEPDWAPPAEVKHDIPSLPNLIRGGTPANPMGVAALVLTGGDYAIHGTNRPQSVGGFVSYGCIRMYNSDITHLFTEVRVGTPVYVEP